MLFQMIKNSDKPTKAAALGRRCLARALQPPLPQAAWHSAARPAPADPMARQPQRRSRAAPNEGEGTTGPHLPLPAQAQLRFR